MVRFIFEPTVPTWEWESDYKDHRKEAAAIYAWAAASQQQAADAETHSDMGMNLYGNVDSAEWARPWEPEHSVHTPPDMMGQLTTGPRAELLSCSPTQDVRQTFGNGRRNHHYRLAICLKRDEMIAKKAPTQNL